MNQNHSLEPLSKNGDNKSFLLLVGWVFGALCLSVPYNLYWKLGNGLLAANILITLILAAAGAILVVASIRFRQRGSDGFGSLLKDWFVSAWKCNGIFWLMVFLLLLRRSESLLGVILFLRKFQVGNSVKCRPSLH